MSLADLSLGNTITYGVVQPGADDPHGVPMIRVNNFTANGLDLSNLAHIAPSIEAKYTRTRLRPHDVLITVVGSVGQVAIVPAEAANWNIARAVALIRPADIKLSRWIALCLRSPFSQHSLNVTANTTVQTTVNLKELKQLAILMPPMREREEIAATLSALDDRIELLRQTNATLEAIAQTLFKSWFVDFDPVRAKTEGREPDGMDAATAALFPDSFEDSSLGPIPLRWRTGTFGDLAILAKGSINPLHAPDTVFEHYSLPAFDAGGWPVFELGASIMSNKTRVPQGTVLQSKLNPRIPRVWLPGDVGDWAVCSTEFLPWIPRANASPSLLYCLLQSAGFAAAVLTLVTGTSNSHQRVKPDQVAALPTVVPDGALIAAFDRVVQPMLDQMLANRQRMQTLTQLRDTLLPRLISGKLRLPNARV